MSEARIATPYTSPEIRDLGHLTVLTAFDGAGLHFAQASLGSLPGGGGGETPGGGTPPGGQNVLGSSAPTPLAGVDAPDASGIADSTDSSPDSSAAPGGGGSGGAERGANGLGSGADKLPFTGLAVAPVAAAGAALTAAGATLRRWARRA